MNLVEYASRLDKAGMGEYRAALIESALPSVRLEPAADAGWEVVGGTRLGGHPDLPLDVEWPANDSGPLSFIAQVNLADAHPCDTEGLLPAAGLLSFFYDAVDQPWGFSPADHGSFAVLFTPASAPLVRREAPSRLDPAGVFSPVALSPVSEQTFIGGEAFGVEEIGLTFDDALIYAGIDRDVSPTAHRLLGHPDHVQGDMQVECQLVTNGLYCGDASGYKDPRAAELRKASGHWRLLLQVDSDDAAGMMWGDVGRLYYWIRREDLLSRNWDLSWLILQSA